MVTGEMLLWLEEELLNFRHETVKVKVTTRTTTTAASNLCLIGQLQGGHSSLKVLEFFFHFSRPWRVLENRYGV